MVHSSLRDCFFASQNPALLKVWVLLRCKTQGNYRIWKQAKKEKRFGSEIRFPSSCICASPATKVTPERCLLCKLGILSGALPSMPVCKTRCQSGALLPCLSEALKLKHLLPIFLKRHNAGWGYAQTGEQRIANMLLFEMGARGTITSLTSSGEKLQASA